MDNPELVFVSEGGKYRAEVTARDIVDASIVNVYKRLREENNELRELLLQASDYILGAEGGCKICPILDKCESLPRCTFPEYFKGRLAEID